METFNIPSVVKGFIFDIDGTLYTNADYVFEQVDVQVRHWAILQGFSNELARQKISDFKQNWAKTHNGEQISLAKTMEALGIPISTSIEWRKTLIKPEQFLHKDERLIQTLKELQKKYKMICVTNNPVITATCTLDALEITQFFESIIGIDTFGVSKPDVRPFAKALEIMQINATECVAVGDRYNIDIELPVQMGMGGILVSGVEDVYKLKNFQSLLQL